MRNPEVTKETILRKSGTLFNVQGYKSTSISEITKATGLTKGAIYRHFANKDALELETLRYLSSMMLEKLRSRIKAQATAGDKLRAVFHFFESYITQPPVEGGCPIINVAIEADDAYPALREQALVISNVMRDSIISILQKGIEHGQIKPDIDKDFYATLMLASLQGAIMLSKLAGNDHDIRNIIKHLDQQVTDIEL